MSTKLSEILSTTRTSLADFVNEIPDYRYVSEAISCPDAIKFKIMEILKDEVVSAKSGVEVSCLDGVRVFTDTWVVLIRTSNTEPILRMYIETSEDNLQ